MKFFDHVRSRLRRPRVLAEYRGIESDSDKLCFFANYHPCGEATAHTENYLRALRRGGFDIVLCSTSPELTAQALRIFLKLCCVVIHRENAGYDFYSWKTCFERVAGWQTRKALLLTNDSILGPIKPLGPLWAKIDACEAGLVGLNDSHERGYHLQSFFLYVKAELLSSNAFERFWRKVRVLNKKSDIIKNYEVGFTQQMQSAGCSVEALFPQRVLQQFCLSLGNDFQYPDILLNLKFNATLYCWYELVHFFDYPFVKAAVLRHDCYRSQHYAKLDAMLASVEQKG